MLSIAYLTQRNEHFFKINTSLETDDFLGSKSIESTFFNAILKLQKELSDLDFRIGETQLNSAFLALYSSCSRRTHQYHQRAHRQKYTLLYKLDRRL